jgi:hypothetical protein
MRVVVASEEFIKNLANRLIAVARGTIIEESSVHCSLCFKCWTAFTYEKEDVLETRHLELGKAQELVICPTCDAKMYSNKEEKK